MSCEDFSVQIPVFFLGGAGGWLNQLGIFLRGKEIKKWQISGLQGWDSLATRFHRNSLQGRCMLAWGWIR